MTVLDKGVWHPNKDERELSSVNSFCLPESPEAGRYHLYMSLACPFAHRPYLVIKYLGLEHAISVSSVAAERYSDGWLFDDHYPDEVNGARSLVELYLKANPTYSGKVTVPVLWDKHQNIIVGNDSASLAVELATNWLPLAKNKVDLVPKSLQKDISSLSDWLHKQVNRKVYHVGFATDQSAYDVASDVLFTSLDELNDRLSSSRYLHGDRVTLSDLFLMPTLVRFETIYALHFKANKKSLISFEHLYRYMLDLLAVPSVRETVDLEYSKVHYYFSHKHINPTVIIPAGPEIFW